MNYEASNTNCYTPSNIYKIRLNLAHGICNFLFNKYRFYSSKKIARFLSWLILPSLKKRIICPTIFNFDLCINNNGGSEIYSLGFYEMGTLHIMKNTINQGDIVVDVGSSLGLMSTLASTLVGKSGKVLSFEPDKDRYINLTNSLKLNQCSNVQTFNFGLGSSKANAKLYKDRNSPSMLMVDEHFPHEEVQVDVLDEILKTQNIDIVNFIKIDVEGYEMNVLNGAKKLLSSETAPIVCIEYTLEREEKTKNSNTIFSFLKEINNYSFFQLTKTSSTISRLKPILKYSDLHKHDNLYCFLDSHLQKISKDIFI